MAKAFYLSEEDAEIVRRLAQTHKGLTGKDGPRMPQGNDLGAPEVYVVEIPTAGIPGLTKSGSDYIPGHAVCNLYSIWTRQSDTDDCKLYALTGFTEKVYNLSTGIIYASGNDKFRLVSRDKFGNWVVTGPGSSNLLGKLDEELAYEGSATMSVWDGTSDTTVNVEVYDWLLSSGQTVAAGTKVVAALFLNGLYYVTGAQCE
jgi:hypothetical protein